jgi:hypothetical protein
MFDIGEWAVPKRGLLPIDSEPNRKKARRRQITSPDPLQINGRELSGEKTRLSFNGLEGQYLAAFFDPQTVGIIMREISAERNKILAV